MKARMRRLSVSVDSPFIDHHSGSSHDESKPIEVGESRIERVKKLLASPLSRRKSSCSRENSISSGFLGFGRSSMGSSFSEAKVFGCPLYSLAHQQHPLSSSSGCGGSTSLLVPSPTPSASSLTLNMTHTGSFSASQDTGQGTISIDSASFSSGSSGDSCITGPFTKCPKEAGIPYVISRLCHYIEGESGLEQEGLFRISGNAKLVDKLRTTFDETGDANLEEDADVHSAAALVKLFLRELPEPVIPHHLHHPFFDAVKGLPAGRQECVDRIKSLVVVLPDENFLLLKYLSQFLHKVSSNESLNRMNPNSLGIVFGPNVFRLSAEDYKDLKDQAISGPNQVVACFISDVETIFAGDRGIHAHPAPSTPGHLLLCVSLDSSEEPCAKGRGKGGRSSPLSSSFRGVKSADYSSPPITASPSVSYSFRVCDKSVPSTSSASAASTSSTHHYHKHKTSNPDFPTVSAIALTTQNVPLLFINNEELKGPSSSSHHSHHRGHHPCATGTSKSARKRKDSKTVDPNSFSTLRSCSEERVTSVTPTPRLTSGGPDIRRCISNEEMIRSKTTGSGRGSFSSSLSPHEMDASPASPSSSSFGSCSPGAGDNHHPSEAKRRHSSEGTSDEGVITTVQQSSGSMDGASTSGRKGSSSGVTIPPATSDASSSAETTPSPSFPLCTPHRVTMKRHELMGSTAITGPNGKVDPTVGSSHHQHHHQQQEMSSSPSNKMMMGGGGVGGLKPRSHSVASTILSSSTTGVGPLLPVSCTHPSGPSSSPSPSPSPSPHFMDESSSTNTNSSTSRSPSPSGGRRSSLMQPATVKRQGFTKTHRTNPIVLSPSSPGPMPIPTTSSSQETTLSPLQLTSPSTSTEMYPPTGETSTSVMEKIASKDTVKTKGNLQDNNNNQSGHLESVFTYCPPSPSSMVSSPTPPHGSLDMKQDITSPVSPSGLNDPSSIVSESTLSSLSSSSSDTTNPDEEIVIGQDENSPPSGNADTHVAKLRSSPPVDPLGKKVHPMSPCQPSTSACGDRPDSEPFYSWPFTVRASQSASNIPSSFDRDHDRTLDDDEASSYNNLATYPLAQSSIVEQFKNTHHGHEAPVSPSAYRSHLGRIKRLADTAIPPSPPLEHDSFSSSHRYRHQSTKDLKKRINGLKKSLKQFEFDYEQKYGMKPTPEQKGASSIAQTIMMEMMHLKKTMNGIQDDVRLSDSDEDVLPSGSRGKRKQDMKRKGRSEVDSWLLEERLKQLNENLVIKRALGRRPEDLTQMTSDQIFEEKVDLQKVLLNFESEFGRPNSKKERDIMRSVYDRYRIVKRMVSRHPTLALSQESSNSQDGLQPIPEHVVVNFPTASSPSSKEMMVPNLGPSTSKVDDNEVSNPTVTASSLDPSISSMASVPSTSSGPSMETNLHELPLSDLLDHVKRSRGEKRQLRRIIRTFEEDFTRKNGHKADKEDRVQIEAIYTSYKHVKGKIRLLEALVSKSAKGQQQQQQHNM